MKQSAVNGQQLHQWKRVLGLFNDQVARLSANSIFREYTEIGNEQFQLQAEMEQAYVREVRSLKLELKKVRGQMELLESKMSNLQPGEAYLCSIRELMTSIQNELGAFKATQRIKFQELQQQYEVLDRSVHLFAQHLHDEAWDAEDVDEASQPVAKQTLLADQVNSGSQHVCKRRQQQRHQQQTGLLPEVIEFDAYDEEYGPYGNWHPDDHNEFLSLLRAHKGDYASTVLACCDKCVGGDRLDIIAHARWYSQYEQLELRKRVALQDWRQQKDIAAAAQKQETESGFQQRRHSTRSHKSMQAENAAREHTKAMLAVWKACKAEEERTRKEEQAMAAKQRREQERARREQRQQGIAQMLAQRRQQQEAEGNCQVDNKKKAMQAQAGMTHEKRAALQERNERLLERRQAAIQAKGQEQTARASRQARLASKVKVHAADDPERLFRPTTASEKRVMATAAEDVCKKDSGYIRHVTHKGAVRFQPG